MNGVSYCAVNPQKMDRLFDPAQYEGSGSPFYFERMEARDNLSPPPNQEVCKSEWEAPEEFNHAIKTEKTDPNPNATEWETPEDSNHTVEVGKPDSNSNASISEHEKPEDCNHTSNAQDTDSGSNMSDWEDPEDFSPTVKPDKIDSNTEDSGGVFCFVKEEDEEDYDSETSEYGRSAGDPLSPTSGDAINSRPNGTSDGPILHGDAKIMNFAHLPHDYEMRDGKVRKRKIRCKQCSKQKLCRYVSTFCPGCPERPGLCLGACFRNYHKDAGFHSPFYFK